MAIVRGLFTLLSLGSFLVLTIWIARNRNKKIFESAAHLPLEDADRPPQPRP